MRWSSAERAFAAIVVGLGCVLPSHLSAEPRQKIVVDRIVAVVDHVPITLVELRKRAASATSANSGLPEGERLRANRAAENHVLDELIDDRVIGIVAASERMTVSDEEIDKAVASVMKDQSLTPEKLDEALVAAGISRDDYRGLMRGQLLRGKVVLAKVWPTLRGVHFDDADATNAAIDKGLRVYLDKERLNHFIEKRY